MADGDHLNSTLCHGYCTGECRSYTTPLNSTCYNGQSLFPGDPSWGNVDVMDAIVDGEDGRAVLERNFFDASNTSACLGPSDLYTLPLNECVGPFGRPRPWGTFSLVASKIEAFAVER